MRLPIPARAALLALVCAAHGLLATPAQAQVTFPVSFDSSANPLTASERAAVISHTQAAGRRWAEALGISGPRSIEVEIGLADIATANGASLTAAFVGVVAGRDTFEQGMAAELRTGVDPNGASADVRINFSLTYLRNELWFDPDPLARSLPVPIDRTDAQSVFLHEFGHAIAYNGWANGQGVPPSGFWSLFDRWMQPGSPTRFVGPAVLSEWGSAPELTTNNISHWGNGMPRASAAPKTRPVQWRHGAPVPHFDCDHLVPMDRPADGSKIAQGNSLIAQLMNGVVFYRGTRYTISGLDEAVLIDVGLLSQTRLFGNGFESP